MKNKTKAIIAKLLTSAVSLSCLSLFVAANTASSAWLYQREEPEALKKFKK